MKTGRIYGKNASGYWAQSPPKWSGGRTPPFSVWTTTQTDQIERDLDQKYIGPLGYPNFFFYHQQSRSKKQNFSRVCWATHTAFAFRPIGSDSEGARQIRVGFVSRAHCLRHDPRASSWKGSEPCHWRVHFPCTERTAATKRTVRQL
jgi:hypothetical protein